MGSRVGVEMLQGLGPEEVSCSKEGNLKRTLLLDEVVEVEMVAVTVEVVTVGEAGSTKSEEIVER